MTDNINIIKVSNQNVLIAPEPSIRIIQQGIQGIPGTSGGLLIEEVPTGLIDGSNTIFTLTHEPLMVIVYLNGLAQGQSNYSVVGSVITLDDAPFAGDELLALYSASN
jgi:hypothetical protein